MFEAYGGHMYIGSHSFVGVSRNLFWAMSNGFLELAPSPTIFTMVQNPLTLTAGGCAVLATMGGLVQVNPSPAGFSNPGFVQGPKYTANLGGVIATSGLGVNYFPGSVAGTPVSFDAVTGGVYQ